MALSTSKFHLTTPTWHITCTVVRKHNILLCNFEMCLKEKSPDSWVSSYNSLFPPKISNWHGRIKYDYEQTPPCNSLASLNGLLVFCCLYKWVSSYSRLWTGSRYYRDSVGSSFVARLSVMYRAQKWKKQVSPWEASSYILKTSKQGNYTCCCQNHWDSY